MSDVNSQSFYVVGNGPSLTESLVRSLPPGRWLGMNSAFRFWKKINHYPKYYACLDPVVVKSQAEGILALFKDSPIEEYFLHDAILEIFPELNQDARFYSFTKFLNKETWIVPLSRLGYYKQTTGSLATRFVIEKGETSVTLLGIDCNYVEVISEANQSAGNELVISKHVNANPNYFFSGYQEVGDRYQIPNPAIHSGNLHLQSFVALHSDILACNKPIEIFVGGEESLLNKHGVFRFRDYWSNIGFRKLQCVAVPLTLREIDAFLENLKLWLNPRLKPSLFFLHKGTVLHLFFPEKEDNQIIRRIDDLLKENSEIYSYFDSIKITFFGFPQSVDYYVRKLSPDEFKFCTKSGPNLMFLCVMAHCSKYEFTLQIESDCLPIKAGWLDATNSLISGAGDKPWIIGPAYWGPTDIDSSYRTHVNGNAIYGTGNIQFQRFVEELFTPLLKNLIRRGVNDLAYDTTLSLAFSNLGLLDERFREPLLRVLPRIRHTNLLLNAGGRKENEADYSLNIKTLLKSNSEAFFVHGSVAVNAIKKHIDELGLYFASHPSDNANELPTGHCWANCAGYNDLGFLGYGHAVIKGHPEQKISNVVLHFVRLSSESLSFCKYYVVGKFFGTVEAISKINVLFIDDSHKAHKISDSDSALFRHSLQDGLLNIAVDRPPTLDRIARVGIQLEICVNNKQDEVSIAIEELKVMEIREQPTPQKSLEIEPKAEKINQIIESWSDFVSSNTH